MGTEVEYGGFLPFFRPILLIYLLHQPISGCAKCFLAASRVVWGYDIGKLRYLVVAVGCFLNNSVEKVICKKSRPISLSIL